ncbi:NUDIX domain-containing protein [Streptomyces roseifaciens]
MQEPEGTAALIVNSAGEYLLHLRDNIEGICDPGTWSLLGGNRDSDDETPEAAIARELKEEVGLILPELEKYTVLDAHGPLGGQITVFLGHWDGDARALPLTEGIMLGWFPAVLVPRLVMSPWAKSVIERHEAERAHAPVSAAPTAIGAAGDGPRPGSDFYCDEALSGRTPITVVAETDAVLAFEHTRPSYPVHIVVVPKQHTPSLVARRPRGRDPVGAVNASDGEQRSARVLPQRASRTSCRRAGVCRRVRPRLGRSTGRP